MANLFPTLIGGPESDVTSQYGGPYGHPIAGHVRLALTLADVYDDYRDPYDNPVSRALNSVLEWTFHAWSDGERVEVWRTGGGCVTVSAVSITNGVATMNIQEQVLDVDVWVDLMEENEWAVPH